MNKKIIYLIVFLVIVVAIIAGVTLTKSKKEKGESMEANGGAEATFSIKYDNVEIVPGTEFKEDAISKEFTKSEIPSCAFDGIDKVYTYDNLEIIVASVNGKDTVYSVYFIDDEVETAEGVKITDTKDKMIEKYGSDYKEGLGNKYTYTKGNVELSFTIESDVVTGIEYALITTK